jgi:thermosome
MLVEISKATDNEVGDGTTSAVILAGALLENAEILVLQDVHPTIIVDGYRKAAQKAKEVLEKMADKVSPTDKDVLERIARTSMQTKLVRRDSVNLADMIVKAVMAVAEKTEDGYRVDIDDIKVEKKAGGSIKDSSITKGIILDKEVVHSGMPKKIEKAKIAIINNALEIDKTEFDAKINIQNPQQMKSFLDEEGRMIKNMVDKVVASGANVLFCQKGIDDMAQHYLAKAGVLTVRRVKESDMTKLAKATGARMITNLDDLFEKDLGSAELVEERKIESDRWVFVEGCKHPKAVTLLVRAGSQRVVDEVERSVHDALMVVKDVMENPMIVAGGGAPETYAATKLREWAKSLEGREQLAVEKFADSLEVIPITLAENAGMDPIDTLASLRSKQLKGNKWTGIDVMKGQVASMHATDIFEPLAVKNQIISSATEAACMILRIDDVISITRTSGPPGGGMGGMGGMEGMGSMGGMGGMGMPPMGME